MNGFTIFALRYFLAWVLSALALHLLYSRVRPERRKALYASLLTVPQVWLVLSYYYVLATTDGVPGSEVVVAVTAVVISVAVPLVTFFGWGRQWEQREELRAKAEQEAEERAQGILPDPEEKRVQWGRLIVLLIPQALLLWGYLRMLLRE